MEKKPCPPRDLLLQYLGGNEQKLAHYLDLLAACASAFEVAGKVVRRVYLEEDIPHEVFKKESFYGLFAVLAPDMKGGPLKPKTLYYHIAKHLPEWQKERARRREEMPRNYGLAHVPRRFSRDGTVDAIVHIRSDKVPETILRELEYCIEKGWATLYELPKSEMQKRIPPMLGGVIGAIALPLSEILLGAFSSAVLLGQYDAEEKLRQRNEQIVIMKGIPAKVFSQIVEKLRGKVEVREETDGIGQPWMLVNVW